MLKAIKWISKAFVSGCIAFVILTFFCAFYYNIPGYSTNTTGATDYSWEHNKFYSRGTEGFALGSTNNEGYLNSKDYYEGMQVDVLIMGSSHMEGYNVDIKDSTAYQLELMLQTESVYNIGVSRHNFLVCSGNLESALETYNPQKYVVIETSTLVFKENDLKSAVDGTVEELSVYTKGIISILLKNQFLRLLYFQLQNYSEARENVAEKTFQNIQINTDLYSELLSNLSQTAKNHNVDLVILYHPKLQINNMEDEKSIGDVYDIASDFSEICESYGIKFVDMSERFASEYSENHILPRGFWNTSIGSGHLNKYGHRMIAEELYKVMREEN